MSGRGRLPGEAAVSRHGEAVIFSDGPWGTALGLFAIVFLVFANGFFVAAEFALVAVRRSGSRSWSPSGA